ncbi:hypothetical protein [Nostoc sp.]|uniref:hypothetical protein n=1 Tax=Nostoc sp. TaxID=1180 RepID=UPI002FFD1CA7
MDARELIQRYAAGEKDFTGIRIEGGSLENSDLPEIILRDAMLYNIEMQNTNLHYFLQSHYA